MKFRIKDLKKYLKGEIRWVNVAADLNLKSFETAFDGKNLDIEILPNRFPDAASLIGLSKEISAIAGYSFIEPQFKLKESKNCQYLSKFIKIKHQTSKCVSYFARVILGVKNQKSPQWLQEFVEFYGFNSVNLLVDVSNFVMIEYGAPVHMFDLDVIKGDFIIREAKEGEVFRSLTNKEFILPAGAVVIENNHQIIDLVGIQGGELAKTTLATKNILIHSPIIEPAIIRAVSKKINFQTDASYRFARKIPVTNSSKALDRLTGLIQEIAGFKTLSKKLVLGGTNELPKIVLRFQKIKEYSGLALPAKRIEIILKKIGCQIIKQTNSLVYVLTPSGRLDLQIEEDLIEEIIRFEGWDKIISALPQSHQFAAEDEILTLDGLSKNIMVSCGYDEILNYSFIDEGDFNLIGYDLNQVISCPFDVIKPIKVSNPVSKNFSIFRPCLFVNLIKAAKNNFNFFKEIRIFEIGKAAVWTRPPANKNPIQPNNQLESLKLGFLISLPNWQDTLLEASGLIRTFFEKIGAPAHLKNAHLNIFESSAFVHLENESEFPCSKLQRDSRRNSPQRAAENFGVKVGFVGFLNKELIKFYDLDQKVAVGEFDLGLLLKNLEQKRTYEPVPEFPAVIRDISLIIPEMVQIDDLESEIQFLGDEILEAVDLFDIYQLENLPDKKSVSFRLVFRAKDRSLRDEEINKIMQKIAHSLVNKFGAGIR